MIKEGLINELRASKEFFDRSTRCLEEKHSAESPVEGMMTAAQQVAHVAQTIDWFIEGATRPEGFDLDFEAHAKGVQAITSLAKAREWYEKSHGAALKYLDSVSDADLQQPLPEGPVMGGAPRLAIFPSIVEHTAHHRGALTVYSRAIGLTPAMPYMEAMPA